MKRLIIYMTMFLLLVPTLALAANENTVVGNLQSFVDAFQALFNGNPDGFVAGLVASLPLFGLVVIIFGLMFFVSKVTIFKSPEHDKYARMIAIGVALLGLAQQTVYNAILNLSRVFLILAFLIAIVFMFIMFVNYNRKAHLTSHAELHGITGQALTARKDLEKIKHELHKDSKLYEKTERDLKKLSSNLGSIKTLSGNELSAVDRIADLLRKASAASHSGTDGQMHEYVAALGKDIGSLITTLKHEDNDIRKLDKHVEHISRELHRLEFDADHEKSEEEHVKKVLKKLGKLSGHDIDDAKAHKIIFENNQRIQDQERALHINIRNIRKHLLDLNALKNAIEQDAQEINQYGYRNKHLQAQEVRSAVMNKQFNDAHQHLDKLRSFIEHERQLLARAHKHEEEIMHLLSSIDSEERSAMEHIKTEMATLASEQHVADEAASN